MSIVNPLNVFRGADSVRQYFNPDEQPPLPLVELPETLNPFRQDGVRIYAKMLTALPAQNVKALPVLNMLLNDSSAARKSIVEVSSGSTVTSLGITARVLYGNDDTTAFVSNKASLDRMRELQFFGLRVALYGGPTYTDTTDSRGPVEWARRLGRESTNMVNLGQYDNEANWKSHVRWTGPQIWKQLPEINLFCMGMGSTGCVTGTGMYLKTQKPSVKVLGVCNVEADLIPGPRERPMHETSPFPWKEVVDATESVGSKESYQVSLELSRQGLIAGPSSGMALQGLYAFLQREKNNGTLGRYADPSTAELSCVFVCCDLPQKHLDSYFKKLSPEYFKPIVNDELLAIDQNVYSFRWEIDPTYSNDPIPSLVSQIHSLGLSSGPAAAASPDACSSIRILDLRSRRDFESCHVTTAYNASLPKLTAETVSPFNFDDTTTLVEQCQELDLMLIASPDVSPWLLKGKESAAAVVVVVCYNGECSRIMAAILRSRGIEGYSFREGMNGIARLF
ncbi:MAG: hypothetical protein Q9168_002463 [Polycauliona sp. 1 TL-2023]